MVSAAGPYRAALLSGDNGIIAAVREQFRLVLRRVGDVDRAVVNEVLRYPDAYARLAGEAP